MTYKSGLDVLGQPPLFPLIQNIFTCENRVLMCVDEIFRVR